MSSERGGERAPGRSRGLLRSASPAGGDALADYWTSRLKICWLLDRSKVRTIPSRLARALVRPRSAPTICPAWFFPRSEPAFRPRHHSVGLDASLSALQTVTGLLGTGFPTRGFLVRGGFFDGHLRPSKVNVITLLMPVVALGRCPGAGLLSQPPHLHRSHYPCGADYLMASLKLVRRTTAGDLSTRGPGYRHGLCSL